MTQAPVTAVTAAAIRSQVNQCEQIIKAWEDDDSPELMVMFQGRESKAISEAIHEGFRDLIGLVSTDQIDIDAQTLALAIDEFDDALSSYTRRATVHENASTANPGGTNEFWQAWQALLAAAVPPPYRAPLASIEDLVSQKVNPRQIAKIYDWWEPGGQPDIRKVHEEIAHPGTHYDPATHESVHQRRQREKSAGDWEARQSRRRNRGAPREAEQADRPTYPTSIEDLIRQGVGSKQIAMMKQVDQQTVRDLARQLGLECDGVAPGPNLTPAAGLDARRRVDMERHQAAADRAAEQAAADQLAGQTEAAEDADNVIRSLNNYSELNNAKEQVRQMTWDGAGPRDIHKALAEQHPALKLQSVSQYARKATEEADTPATEAAGSA